MEVPSLQGLSPHILPQIYSTRPTLQKSSHFSTYRVSAILFWFLVEFAFNMDFQLKHANNLKDFNMEILSYTNRSYTHMPPFIVLYFIALHKYCVFFQTGGLWQPDIKHFYQHHLFNSISSLVSLCHNLVTLAVFQTFSLLMYFSWYLWSVVFDVTIVIIWGHHEQHP